MASVIVDKFKYVFFGSPRFASIILERLIKAGYAPKAIVCNPDRPAGRKKIITMPPVKQLVANGHWPCLPTGRQIEILQPENLSPAPVSLSSLKADFAIVASYSKIIPKEVLGLFPLGAIGVHPSLLPKYRGPSPIQSAILNGETETGATLYLMDEKIDNGPILANSKLRIKTGDTYEILHDKLANLSAELLIENLPKFLKGEIAPIPQNRNQATFTKKFKPEDAFIDLEDLNKAQHCGGPIAKEICNKIRALNPEPGAWTLRPIRQAQNKQAWGKSSDNVQGKPKRVKILEVALCKNGHLILKKIQIEGKKSVELQ